MPPLWTIAYLGSEFKVDAMDIQRISEQQTEPAVTSQVAGRGLSTSGPSDGRLQLNVLYTSHSGTRAALQLVSRMAVSLSTSPRVLRLYVVPYALPLERPPVSVDVLEEQLRALAGESKTEFSAHVYLCRETRKTLHQLFPPRSLIVLGGKKRWWPTKEQRWADQLRKEGHEVIFVNAE
jgi:hypothetical protein